MNCPVQHNKLRGDLPPMPPRVAKLPVGKNGYPIPYFVEELGGSREDFRLASGSKLVRCAKLNLCWVCGEPMGRYKVFVVGPMCVVNRVSADAPAHLECAEWSVRACPFLLRPGMVRREDEATRKGEENVAGVMIKRNPGVMAVYVVTGFKVVPDHQSKLLFKLPDPVAVSFWREGRPASRAEVLESVRTGLPLLRAMCGTQKELDLLEAQVAAAEKFFPEDNQESEKTE